MPIPPARFETRQCNFAGYVDIPMFETPFFAAGVATASMVNGRFSAVVAPNGTNPGDMNQCYRPDVTVLNNTPCLIPNNSGQAIRYTMTPYFLASAAHPGGIMTAWNQRVPFGVNFPNPVLSTQPFNPSPGIDGQSLAFEGIFAGFNSFPITTIAIRGILDGYDFYFYDPLTPSNFHFLNGPNWSNGSGFGFPYPSYMAAKYPIFVNNDLQSLGDDNMYWLGGGLPTGATQMQIARWGNRPNGDALGLQSQLSFDTTSLNNQLANPASFSGPPVGTIGCRFGFLIPNLNSTTPGQARDIMLLSMDQPSYKLIRLVAQTSRASAFIAGNTNGYCFHIDQSGIAYAFDYNDGGRMYTSFGLDIPFNPPLIDALQFAPLPCFSPCYPFFLTPSL